MKRKALIILTVAILAFAMIPAIGVTAQTAGDVKIVTPDELANPSGTRGSSFDRLESADFVSDKTGTGPDAMLEDAGGTLYAVIEDNDAEANKLVTYHAIFQVDYRAPGKPDDYPAAIATVIPGGNRFYLDPTTERLDDDAGRNAGYARRIVDGDGRLVPFEEGDVFDLQIGDRNRDGVIDADDITLEVGWAHTALTSGNVQRWEKDRSVPDSAYSDIHADGKSLYLNLGQIPNPRTLLARDNLPGFIAQRRALRISFASAATEELTYATGTQAGQSRVEVRSSSGETIRIPAVERDLDAFTGAGVTAAMWRGDTAVSRDSGTYVGIFGVIANDFKDAASDWEPSSVQVRADVEVEIAAIAADSTETGENEFLAHGPTDTSPFSRTVDVTFPDPGQGNSIETDNLNIWHFEFSTARDDDPDVIPDSLVVEGWTVADGAATAGGSGDVTLTITFTTDNAIIDGDIFAVLYDISQRGDSIGRLIEVVEETGTADATDESDVFDEFCDGSRPEDESTAAYEMRCAGVLELAAALRAHQANFGFTDDDSATVMLNLLIGVEHGDTLSVRYADANPRGTRSESAEVDLVAPTISGLNPVNGSYVAEDDFSVLFDVTDQDSGILDESQDITEAAIRTGTAAQAYVHQEVMVAVGANDLADPADMAEIDRDEEITGGERYEIEIDVSKEAEDAENDDNDDKDAETVRVQVRITAYDRARNMAKVTVVNYVVDTIDPVLLRAITGIGVASSSDAPGRSGSTGAYVLKENQRDSIVLVFDDTIQGDEVRAQDITIIGTSVTSITWLNNAGSNYLSVGNTTSLSKSANDLDFSAATTTSEKASDIVSALGLTKEAAAQDARHLLFLTLEGDLDTDSRPSIEIDGDDLADLADNMSRSDHQARPIDRLAPIFTVTVGQALSNDALDVEISASESLDRTPRTRIVRKTGDSTTALDRSLTIRAGTGNMWSASTDRDGLGLTARNGSQDGVYQVEIIGNDENDNRVITRQGTWELDTRANGGADPARVGGNSDKAISQQVETNDTVFLSLDFDSEGSEYFEDSEKGISITGLTLQSLASNAINAQTKRIAANPTVESSEELDTASANTSNGVRHVVALTEPALGHYRLNIAYADAAGNTGTFGYVFTVIAPKPVTVSVAPGWSLISIPGAPQDRSISSVLAGSSVTHVWSLNNETKIWEFARMNDAGEWTGTLSQMEDGRAYFVRSGTFDPITVQIERFSPQRTPAQYRVTAGWNSIGYTPAGSEQSVAVDAYLSSLGLTGWGLIRSWNEDATPPGYETYFSSGTATDGFPTDENGVAIVETGKGYLLFATRNGVIGG